MSYSEWIMLAAAGGVLISLARRARTADDVIRLLTGYVFVGAGALVAGRLGFTLQNLDYFAARPADIVSLRSPGYAEAWAVAGGFVGWLASRRRVPAIDLILTATLIGGGACLGCLRAGCGYGREVFWQDGGLGWLLRADLPDAYSVANPRWPTQLMTLAWLLLSLVTASVLSRRLGEIQLLLSWILMVTLGQTVVMFFAADPAPIGLTLAATGIALLAATATILSGQRRRPTPTD